MAKQRNISELSKYIRQTRSVVRKSHAVSLLRVTQDAELYAKKNAIAQFTGRNERRLSGRLLNSIFSGFKVSTTALPSGFVGVRGIPYGAIHEFGGTIEPKKAKALWIKQHKGKAGKGIYKRMTPTDFFNQKKAQRGKKNVRQRLALRIRNGKITAAGFEEGKKKKFTPLFFTAEQSIIPKRPYVVPAVRKAALEFPSHMRRSVARLLKARFFK